MPSRIPASDAPTAPPWSQPESVFDSALTRAMRMITNVLGPSPEEQIFGLAGAMELPGTKNILSAAVEKLGERAKGFIKAYHGSPHDFERFSTEKIGTGEGAQAYGHGLYFAENKNVAQGYQDALKWKGTDWDSPERIASQAYDAANSDRMVAAQRLEQTLEYWDKNPPKNPAQLAANEKTRQAARMLREDVFKPGAIPKGRMYEVAIHADPEDFLDWDKPLSQQSEKVQKRLADAWLAHPEAHAKQKGSQIAEITGMQTGMIGKDAQVGASRLLNEAGIPGIKYLDAGSRSAGEGSRNYVVFDDQLVTILRKYGVAGALGAGYTAQQIQAAQQQRTGGD